MVHKTTHHVFLFAANKANCVACKSNFLDHTSILFKNLITLTLFELIKQKNAIFMYKAYHNLSPLNLLEHFLQTSSCHSTRQSKLHSIIYIGSKRWNTLQIIIKDSINRNLFRLRYKTN